MGLNSREKFVREIVELIEDNRESWIKAAFYSDPKVEHILEELYKRWERNSMQGLPLDYASQDEIEILRDKARHYASLSPAEAQRIALQRRMYK